MDSTTNQTTDGAAAQVGLDLVKLDRDLQYILTCIERGLQGAAGTTVNDIRKKIASAQRASQPGANETPVARLHIELDDDGLRAKVEVLDGTYLQVEHSPVDVYIAPPASKNDMAAKDPALDNLLVDVSGLLRPLVEDGQAIRVKHARDVLSKVFAEQRARSTR